MYTRDRTSDRPQVIDRDHLAVATCRTCRGTIYASNLTTGRPVTFDIEIIGRDEVISLHACHYEPGPEEDLDDPDWGWISE